MFKRVLILGFLLSVAMVACPAPIVDPVLTGTATTLSGSISPWTRGARIVRTSLNGPNGAVLSVFDGAMNQDGTFTAKLGEPTADDLFVLTGPRDCGAGISISSSGTRISLVSDFGVFTSQGVQSGVLIKATPNQRSPLQAGDKFALYVFADRDSEVTADCPSATGGAPLKINWSLKRGWNTTTAELLAGNTLRFYSEATQNALSWQFISASGSTFSIDNAPAALESGRSVKLIGTFKEPDGTPIAGSPTLNWFSSDPTVASVDDTGKLSAKRPGGVQISVSVPSDPASGATFNLTVYGLEVSGGTINLDDQKLGVIMRLRYVDPNGNTTFQPYDLTLTGPSGWNNNQPLALKASLAPLRMGNFRSPFQSAFTEITALDGTYSVRLESAPVAALGTATFASNSRREWSLPTQALQYPRARTTDPIRAQAYDGASLPFTVDTTKKRDTVRNLRISTDQSNNVSMQWDSSQSNPSSYLFEAEVFDQTTAQIAAPRVTAYGGSVSFNGANLDKTHTYQLRVYAISDDYESINPGTPYAASKTTAIADFRPFVTQVDGSGGSKAGGYSLTLYGQNFDADTKIFFGSVEATTKLLQGSTQMQTVVPAGMAGTVDIVLKDKNNAVSVAAARQFRYYDVSEYAAKSPWRLLAGTGGVVSYIEYDSSLTPPVALVKITASGSVTRIGLPSLGNVGAVQDLALDSSGRVWIALSTKVIRVNANNSLTEVALPSGVQAAMIAFGSDGNLWIARADSFKISRIKPDGTAAVEFTLLNNSFGVFNTSNEMLLAPDGNLWFTSAGSSSLGRVTSSGAVTMFSSQSIDGLTVSGTELWGSNYSALVRIASDGTITGFSQTCSGRFTPGSNKTFWCTNSSSFDNSLRLGLTTIGTPASNVTQSVILSPVKNFESAIAVVTASDGKIWYTTGSKIGVITP